MTQPQASPALAAAKILLAETSEAVLLTSHAGHIIFAGGGIIEHLHRTEVELVGEAVFELIVPGDRERLTKALAAAAESTAAGQTVITCRMLVEGAPSGSKDFSILNLPPGNVLSGLRITIGPASGKTMTTLGDRGSFIRQIAQASTNHDATAIVALEMSGLAAALDPEVEQRLLASVSRRITACIGPDDVVSLIAPRQLGVLLCDVSTEDEIKAIITRIQRRLAPPVAAGGVSAMLRAAIGYSERRPEQTHEGFLLAAVQAVSRAHTKGGRVHGFNTQMRYEDQRRMQLALALPDALAKGQLQVHYQPIINLQRRVITGFEALVRWNHGALGTVPPGEFIPLAEELHFIVPLDRFVLLEACRNVAKWPGAPKISVNLSARQLDDPATPDAVATVLRESGLPASQLQLEVTETALAYNADSSRAVLAAIKALGVQLAMDDFATGYSSFSQLAEMPVDVVKIDRSFVSRMTDDKKPTIGIVQGIITMTQQLGLECVAEGIEEEEECGILTDMGCTYGQGWLFSKAVPAEQALALLQKQ